RGDAQTVIGATGQTHRIPRFRRACVRAAHPAQAARPAALMTHGARTALRTGAREALGVPAAVLGAGFLGYGSLAADAGYSIWMTLAATFAIWALPGQLVLMEMHAGGAAAMATVLAVSLSAARFLPMTL